MNIRKTDMSRRALMGLGSVALGGLALSACSTGSSDSNTSSSSAPAASDGGSAVAKDAFPVTIEHAYGSTTIDAAPKRIATVGWGSQDAVLALGTVPVGVPGNAWAGNARKSSDWFDEKLKEMGAELPVLFNETDGPDYEAIAKTNPDLIIGTYSGMTQEQYDKLSKIAKTLAYPKGVAPWSTPWQENTKIIGKAMGREAEAEKLVKTVEGEMSSYGDDHSEIKGTTFIYSSLDPAAASKINVYAPFDVRTRFLAELGMTVAPFVEENAPKNGKFFFPWPPEKADQMVSDIILTRAAKPELGEAIMKDPLLSRIPAVKRGALVVQSNRHQLYAIATSSVLSIPWVLKSDAMTPILEACKKAKSS